MSVTSTLLLRGLARGKARFACAALGVAAAAGAVVFVFSLAASNAAQAPSLARRAATPWAAWRFEGMPAGPRGAGAPRAPSNPSRDRSGASAPDLSLDLVSLTLDYRPGGRVLQGPPMRAIVAAAPAENPWGCTRLAEGRWTDDAAADAEVVCTRGSLRRFGRGEPPPLGERLKFVGMQGTMTATLVGYLEDAKLPPGWPSVFANRAAFAALSAEHHGTLRLWREAPADAGADLLGPSSEMVVNAFKGDENRRMDYARPLLLVAAVLTALSLLVNSLLLAVEANRRTLALLRTVGLSRGGVARLVAAESLLAVAVGWALGCAAALATIRYMLKNDIPGVCRKKGEVLKAGLQSLADKYPDVIQEVRGTGLMLAVEFHTCELGYETSKGLFARRVLTAGTLVNAKTIRFEPTAVISDQDMKDVISRMDEALADTRAWAAAKA